MPRLLASIGIGIAATAVVVSVAGLLAVRLVPELGEWAIAHCVDAPGRSSLCAAADPVVDYWWLGLIIAALVLPAVFSAIAWRKMRPNNSSKPTPLRGAA